MFLYLFQILEEKVKHLEHLVQLKDLKIIELHEQLTPPNPTINYNARPLYSMPHAQPLDYNAPPNSDYAQFRNSYKY